MTEAELAIWTEMLAAIDAANEKLAALEGQPEAETRGPFGPTIAHLEKAVREGRDLILGSQPELVGVGPEADAARAEVAEIERIVRSFEATLTVLRLIAKRVSP